MNKTILVTGGAGYIGSHTVVQLLQAGYRVIVLDNLSNSHPEVLRRIEKITGKTFEFIKGDIKDRALLDNTFKEHAVTSVIHFAGLKAVGESEAQPLMYYDNNVGGSVTLLEAMNHAHVTTIVFSSSATVYGDPGYSRHHEETPLSPVNVYGKTKLVVENILRDLKKSQPSWRVALLRYFNPIGAHPSGLIGEDPTGIPNNLMPFIAQVAIGKRPKLSVFGGDYPTPDGTGLRDYIHVEDLARGHLAALDALSRPENTGNAPLLTVNLGTGNPYSVLEVVRAFEKASGKTVPYEIVGRRQGDPAACYADPSLAQKLMGWTAQYTLEQMCEDSWRWQKNNPNGYR
ncbi:MAG: UDP-glucose 4-epimerase GalE [Burkholderiales bacterium]|jgi:UDP-glucose 4-epimerase|nr:UDP-glucose 4-epimerase GalE [Burkholderiales bacterium]